MLKIRIEAIPHKHNLGHPLATGEWSEVVRHPRGPGALVARAHYQTFIRWTRLGVWERLLHLAQERGVQLGMTFLGATSIRAHYLAEPRADLPFAASRGGEGGPGHPTNPISQA